MTQDAVTLDPPGLSPEQVEVFHENGYLVVEDVFNDDDLQPAIDDVNQALDKLIAQAVADGRLSSDYASVGFEQRLAKVSEETDQIALKLWNGTLHGAGFFSILSHPKLVNVGRSLCGDELIASSVYRLRPKIPNYGYGAVPWHQDAGYTEPYCDGSFMLTVWLALVDATEDNGCLWVLPNVHRNPEVLTHRKNDDGKYLIIDDENLPPGVEPVCCPVKKGGVVLMHFRTPHVSWKNNTDGVRWSMDLRYQSANLPTNAAITALPDEVRAQGSPGEDGFVPAACYPPEADFLVHSLARPDEVIDTPEKFAALRAGHVPKPVTDRWGGQWAEPAVLEV